MMYLCSFTQVKLEAAAVAKKQPLLPFVSLLLLTPFFLSSVFLYIFCFVFSLTVILSIILFLLPLLLLLQTPPLLNSPHYHSFTA